jgi:hypothetical protein
MLLFTAEAQKPRIVQIFFLRGLCACAVNGSITYHFHNTGSSSR